MRSIAGLSSEGTPMQANLVHGLTNDTDPSGQMIPIGTDTTSCWNAVTMICCYCVATHAYGRTRMMLDRECQATARLGGN